MHTPIKTWLGVTVIIIMALSAGMFIWYQQKNLAVDDQMEIIKPGTKQKACTEEAKVCPDGSAVGRTGPNCEFAPCSEINENMDTSDWQTYRNEKYGFEFRYPFQFTARDEIEDMGQGVYIFGKKDHYGYVKFSVIINKVNNMTLENYLKQIVAIKATITDQNNIIISGSEAIQRTEKHEDKQILEVHTYIKKGNYVYDLNGDIGTTDNIEVSMQNMYNQILSTFKFIK